jgi:thiol-disulfide isomerase/thioredoxin
MSTVLFSKRIKEGVYRGALLIDEKNGLEIPFNFEVKYKGKKPQIIIMNADERIVVDELKQKGDSLNFKMPVFDTEFRTRIVDGNLEGVWINHYKTTNNSMRFKAVFGESKRFLFTPGKVNPVFEGRWETTFSPGTKDSSKAIGVFHHEEQTDYVTGTFLTETGDYRYLDGMRQDNKLYLSTFDGGHAYLFVAELKDQVLSGNFYAGSTWVEPWIAKLNPDFKLRNADDITFLKDKNAVIDFSFDNLDKKTISLKDKKFENKPVIVQLMGSWCPNCMDESRYFSEVYSQYKTEGLEIIALAFEKTTDFEKAQTQLLRLKKRFDINYEILVTQQTGKDKAGEVLSALNKITAFPTTLFLNKQHQVVKIHTGFSGPATGGDYEAFKRNTETLIKNLLKE